MNVEAVAVALMSAPRELSKFQLTTSNSWKRRLNAYLPIKNASFLKVMLSLSAKGTAGLSVNDDLFRHNHSCSLSIQFVELLDNELDIIVTLLLPDARFPELLIPTRLGEVYPNQSKAANRAEFLDKALDELTS